MKAYKGFKRTEDGKLMCRDMEYEVGKKYVYKGDISLCSSGFHACHELTQCFTFYANNGINVFYEVECGGVVHDGNEDIDGKLVCSEITLVKEVDVSHYPFFRFAEGCKNGIIILQRMGCCNYMRKDGTLLSDVWFDEADHFMNGRAVVKRENGKYNLMDEDGKMVLEHEYDRIHGTWNSGFIQVVDTQGANYIDRDGQLLSDKWFWKTSDFYKELAIVNVTPTLQNIINIKGEVLLPQNYDSISNPRDNEVIVGKKLPQDPTRFLDYVFNVVRIADGGETPEWYERILHYSYHPRYRYKVKKDQKENLMDSYGHLISGIWYKNIGEFHEQRCTVTRDDGMRNAIDYDGKLISDTWYESMGVFECQFCRVRKQGKWNFIDVEGNLLLEEWMDDVDSFFRGFARVEKNGKSNTIDTKGRILCDEWYDFGIQKPDNLFGTVLQIAGNALNYWK